MMTSSVTSPSKDLGNTEFNSLKIIRRFIPKFETC